MSELTNLQTYLARLGAKPAVIDAILTRVMIPGSETPLRLPATTLDDDLTHVAGIAGRYYRALHAAELPDELVCQLVRDWHGAYLAEKFTTYGYQTSKEPR